jgi:orotate phosphoribosyltransferase
MPENDRDRLRQMLLDRSMRFGEFVLSSGATSNYYIDVRKTSLHPEGLKMIARAVLGTLEQDRSRPSAASRWAPIRSWPE